VHLLLVLAAAFRVYVSNEASDDVSVIENDHEIARIAVGKRPRGIKLGVDGKLYVAVSGSPRAGPGQDESQLPPADRKQDGIAVVDVQQGKVVARLPGGPDPEAFDLRGPTLFVSNEDASMLSFVDLARAVVTRSVKVGAQPEGVTLSPDGRTVYVTSEEDGEVDAVAVADGKLLARIPVAPRPRAIAVLPDGSKAFVTAEQGAGVDVLDTRHNTALARIAIPGKPMGVALTKDGARLYVSTGRHGSVAEVDTKTLKVTRTVENVGQRPWGLGLSPRGDRLYTANGPSNDVSVIDTKTGAVVARIPAGTSPWGIAVSGENE
jgi:YVTN family beta-propeller protein